jgi:small-conductance mechanosensitive channel
MNAGEAVARDLPVGGPTYRVTAGASFSLGRLFQGRALQARAAVACQRERARAGLEAALAVEDVLGAERALAARAAVLEQAMPAADRMIDGLRAAVQDVRATVDALDSDRLRLEDLRALAAQTSLALSRAAAVPHPPLADVPLLLADYTALDQALGVAEERTRDAGTWDLALRGGYDHISDGRERVPVFAMLSASFDVGRLWRGGADARALQGRARAERESADALTARVARLLDDRRAVLSAERARLQSAGMLLAALSAQMEQVEHLQTVKVERYQHGLWFELVRTRAEHAYLAAHVEELGGALGEPPSRPSPQQVSPGLQTARAAGSEQR